MHVCKQACYLDVNIFSFVCLCSCKLTKWISANISKDRFRVTFIESCLFGGKHVIIYLFTKTSSNLLLYSLAIFIACAASLPPDLYETAHTKIHQEGQDG